MEDKTYTKLKAKLDLDPMELDQEIIELPMLIMEAAECTAVKLAERDRDKNAVDLARSEAADQLRQDKQGVDSKGNPKQRSEAQIESELLLFKHVQEALTKLEQSKFELANWQALCDALRTKRDSLKIFAELTISGYLSPNAALDQRRAEIRDSSKGPRRPINHR